MAQEEANGRAFSIFPLQRTLVPRHIRFCQAALRQLLHVSLGGSENTKTKKREYAKTKRRKTEAGHVVPETLPKKRAVRPKEDKLEEKAEVFSSVLDLRSVRQRHRFAFGFTTDGMCMRLNYTVPPKGDDKATPVLPTRGKHSIDALKRCRAAPTPIVDAC